jgi:hypothetical protein
MTVNPIRESQRWVARHIRQLMLRNFEPPPGIVVSELHVDADMGSIAFTVTEQPSGQQLTIRITNTTGLDVSVLAREEQSPDTRHTASSRRIEMPTSPRRRGRPLGRIHCQNGG